MASIGLYDIDFLHGSKFSLNLELMKVFNYYHKRGHVVNLIKKNENLKRYNKIIFFKESPNLKIPKDLSLTGETKIIYGYGFYNRYIPLDDKFRDIPPDFLVYDIFEDKIKNIKLYKKIKKGSLVRVENEDYSGYNPDSKEIYIVDYDFTRLKNAEEFLQKYNKHNIRFLHSLNFSDKDTFFKLFPYLYNCGRRLKIDFNFDKSFFEKYCNENLFFTLKDMTTVQKIERIVKMGLIAKSKSLSIDIDFSSSKTEIKKDPLLIMAKTLTQWSQSKEKISYHNFIKTSVDYDEIEKVLYEYPKLSFLSKQNPLTYDIQSIDF